MMTSITPVTAAGPPVTVAAVRHWHVTESDAGYLPATEPYTSDDAGMALDALAHLLDEWAQTYDDPEDPDALFADGIAEIYCTCRHGERSAEHHDALTGL